MAKVKGIIQNSNAIPCCPSVIKDVPVYLNVQSEDIDGRRVLEKLATAFANEGYVLLDAGYTIENVSHNKLGDTVNPGRGVNVSSVKLSMCIKAENFYNYQDMESAIKRDVYSIYSKVCKSNNLSYILWFSLR